MHHLPVPTIKAFLNEIITDTFKTDIFKLTMAKANVDADVSLKLRKKKISSRFMFSDTVAT